MSEQIATKVPFDVLKDALTADEGKKLHVYLCTAGHKTIGIGHNIDAKPLRDIIGHDAVTITEAESDKIFAYDLNAVIANLRHNIPWFDDVSDVYQYALIQLGFNIGVGGLLKFKNTLAAFKAGNTANVINGLTSSAWYKQVPNRAKRIVDCLRTNTLPS